MTKAIYIIIIFASYDYIDLKSIIHAAILVCGVTRDIFKRKKDEVNHLYIGVFIQVSVIVNEGNKLYIK